MKFLMCIGGVDPSAETIRFGGRLAKAFEADISVLYVQPRAPHAVRKEVQLAREKLSEWEIELPGVKVLRAAYQILSEEGVLRPSSRDEAVEFQALKPEVRGAYELELPGGQGQNIKLRIREGDIVEEVNKETESEANDLVIFGASRRRRLLQKLIQFVNSSVLIVKNPKDVRYELLLCTDSSGPARKAEIFAARLAHFLATRVLILSVAKFKNREHVAMEGVERASRLLTKAGVRHSAAVRTGRVVEEIACFSREDTVVIMGASRRSEIWKLAFGSKANRIAERVSCPVLIVK
jgi:nucleotide-binding universal stress UspA family protein